MTIHGHAGDGRGGRSPTYNSYRSMKDRCLRGPDGAGEGGHPYWHRYGGRGIKICDRWLHGEDGKNGFECFLADLGPRPSLDYSLDRRNANGDYCKENCEWSDQVTQRANQVYRKLVQYRGEALTLREAWTGSGSKINFGTVCSRVQRGWGVDAALSNMLTPRKGRSCG